MAHDGPYQVGSRTCGCVDCIEDYPPSEYGERPARATCAGPWQVRYRMADGRQRRKNFRSRTDADLFVQTEVVTHGA